MAPTSQETVTQILAEVRAGNRQAVERLLVLLYTDLRRLASTLMADEAKGHTLQPTALVNEAMLRLLRSQEFPEVRDRRHVVRMVTRLMSQILVDHARARNAEKRGGGAERIDLDDMVEVLETRCGAPMPDVADALEFLQAENPRAGEVLRLRVIVGLTAQETADELQVSVTTVERDLRFARARLRQLLADKETS